MNILAIRFGHDAGAAIVIDGKIVVDIAEERLSRTKNDSSFPVLSIDFCLQFASLTIDQIDCLALPYTEFPDIVRTFFDIPEARIPRAKESQIAKLKNVTKNALGVHSKNAPVLPLYQSRWKLREDCRIHLCPHHLAHASSAYFTSGLNTEKVVIATLDGIGDGISVALWRAQHNHIEPLVSYDGSGSLGWFYGNATEGLGWRHGSDEWKVMGLSPYGSPAKESFKGLHPVYKDGALISPHQYGEFGRWNDHGANHYHGKEAHIFQGIAERLGRENYAAEIQQVVEDQAMQILLPWLEKEDTRHLCCAGGFFLNVKFNQNLWYTGKLDTQWIYPNPGDAGLAVGAALHAWFHDKPERRHERLGSLYFGPQYGTDEIKDILDSRGLAYTYYEDPTDVVATHLSKNHVVGWFQGRMESGPRALGSRSILMSPLKKENKDIVNAKIKYREAFRPFCPSILHEMKDRYLIEARDEHFMVSSFRATREAEECMPAVVHVDGTARPQLVQRETNHRYYDLIRKFGDITGVYGVMNTSFNIKGEPIVCHPREAIKCFYDTGIDVLVLGNFVLTKPRLEAA